MCPRPARLGLSLLLVATLLVALSGVSAGAGAAEEQPASRLLIVSVPTLLWHDIDPVAAPNLHAFLEGAAVAGLATRVSDRSTEEGEAYATIGAANRAIAPGDLASLALAPDEPYGLGTAGDEYLRYTGRPLEGAAGLLTIGGLQDANDDASFGAEVGRVGTMLVEEGFSVSVVANADQPRPIDAQPLVSTAGPPSLDLHREAAAALMGRDGIVPGGRVDGGLRRDDPEAALGTRLDPEAVVAAATAGLADDRSVTLVELSDLLLAEIGSRNAADEAALVLETRALTWTDELFGALLAEMDRPDDSVMVVAPTPGGAPHLTVLGVQDAAMGPGLLESAQTRQPGFVTVTDVGPTILDLVGVDQPSGVEGRPAVVVERGGTGADRIARLVDADDAARARDEIHRSVTVFYVWMAVAFVLMATASFEAGRLAAPTRLFGLWLVATLPCTYLAGPMGLAEAGTVGYLTGVWIAGAVLALATLLICRVVPLRRLRPLDPLTLLMVVDMAVIGVSVVVLDSALQLSTIFGDSPIGAGRFSGVNNITFAQLVVAGIVLAALIVRFDRLGPDPSPHRARLLAGLLLGGVLLVDGMPMWGADVGGVLAALPAFAVTWLAISGRSPRWRALIVWSGVTVVVVGLLGLLDLTRPSEDRSHLGRLFERIADDGMRGLWLVVDRKLDQNLRTITGQPWTWLLVITAVALVYLLWRHRARLLDAFADEPELRGATRGMVVALVLGFALNDSGVAVPGMMLIVALPVAFWVVFAPGVGRRSRRSATEADHRTPPDEPGGGADRSGDESSSPDQEPASTPTATSGTLVTTPSTPKAASERI
jgi:hypothetical protein